MANDYKIHRPYVLASLPRPLDPKKGRIVARELYRGNGKKRNEIAVGIDGENASLYDVPTSRLITSYPIPPQETFACAPYSVRVKHSSNTQVLRYTLLATQDGSSRKMTLLKDVMHPEGTKSSTSSQMLPTSPVQYLTSFPSPSQSSNIGDFLAVCHNGELVCLSSESLAIQWTASAKSALQDLAPGVVKDFEVEYVASGSLSDFRDGIFKKRPEIFNVFPNDAERDPLLFVMITKSTSREQKRNRHLIVLAALPGQNPASANSQKLITLGVTPMETPGVDETTCQVDIQTGILLELVEGAVSVYDLTGAVPKLKSKNMLDGIQSFLLLSRPLILYLSSDSVGLFNYQHRSLHAKAALDTSELPPDCPTPRSFQLVTYLRGNELVVALVDNVLVSFHVESPRLHGKRRRTGLLIDSIGCGAAVELAPKRVKCEDRAGVFSHYVCGTISEKYLETYNKNVRHADELLSNNELVKWEDLLRRKFLMKLRPEAVLEDKNKSHEATTSDMAEPPEWDWLTETTYPAVDRRWIMYAISQVFSVDTVDSAQVRRKLRLVLPDSNVTTYLIVAGHLSLSNLISAFRAEVESDSAEWRELTQSLVACLAEADPSMTLVLKYLQATRVGELELLLAIRLLMQSMDMMPDTGLNSAKLLASRPREATDTLETDLDDLERQIAVTEHYLGDESSSQFRSMTLALTKLWRLPTGSTVKAMRATLQREEILALMHLLRLELIRGAWTCRYLDPIDAELEGNEAPPDGVIALIADLLGRCLDAVGTGGWLINDAMSWEDRTEMGDLLEGLKLEVWAALEGVQEAVQLKGTVSEVVRFGLAEAQRPVPQPNKRNDKPIKAATATPECRMLPLGLKSKSLATKEKVGSIGGEILQRSRRELGLLMSRNVEPYSLEKISI
ncbi:hypothetical protein L249_2466 [Ophiocordyceps polyrhachis-furcata BCC 54312]|uniref:Utp8 beta-propeller domain-containing protein n=1 Tax=Ophiocordyceps polyrhachis-furcata BCC 54312 TaxID=1330021 RepID=A0A367LSS7_9HYPO|nr:hypothetical protein L249_2466 [Ophiocordyceps polyrhachis-furcata BCC 54312]